MILLGISGPIGHGKTTLADYLSALEPNSIHLESSALIAEVANSLNQYHKVEKPAMGDWDAINRWLSHVPKAIAEVTHFAMPEPPVLNDQVVEDDPVSFQKLLDYLQACQQNPDLPEQTITPVNKSQYRSILQWLGGYAETHIKSGLWYSELVRRATASGKNLVVLGGVRFEADAAAVQKASGKIIAIERPNYGEQDAKDPTERERTKVTADTTILNNGTLAQLHAVTQRLLHDVRADCLQTSYSAN